MMRRRLITAVLLLAATSALAGCTAPAASVTPPSASTSSPPPTTEAAEPTPALVAITAESIAVLDTAGGIIVSFDYFQPTADVVSGLTTYLGEPVATPNPGGLETPPGTDHVWGGLRLSDTDTPGRVPDIPNHTVFVEGPDAGPLPVSTAPGIGSASGVAVGDPAASLTIGVEAGVPYTDPTTGRTVVVDRVGIVPLPTSTPSTPLDFGVMIVSYTDDGAIARMVAPSANFGV
ncbi:hypothetical protein [Agromyces sp. M3QZ16-3]|uniref:hypothetical protein n=1 Tax=Agromyces sp. M3QZ16-3 TaxID=3447585 RepID=UPI003F691C0C